MKKCKFGKNSIVAALAVSFVFGLKKLVKMKKMQYLVITAAVLFNIILSPSPVSIGFWMGKSFSFSLNSYKGSEREKKIKEGIEAFIPKDKNIRVTAQNSINISYLAKREEYYPFPSNIENADYIVLDLKRPLFILDRVDKEKYDKNLNTVKNSRVLVYEYDNFYIYGRQKQNTEEKKQGINRK